MTDLNKPSSIFLRKVWNQVLINRNIEYVPKYYVFEDMKRSRCEFIRKARLVLRKKKEVEGITFSNPVFYIPKGYPFQGHEKCLTFTEYTSGYGNPVYVFPHNWLSRYDPIIPIFVPDYGHTRYIKFMEFDKLNFIRSGSYFIRDRFQLYDFTHLPETGAPKPFTLSKGDEDWCITHLNIQPSLWKNVLFQSFLLVKNVDFSKYDAQNEAKGLKCPVPYRGNIELKDNSRNGILLSCYYNNIVEITCFITPPGFRKSKVSCICINCRKDCRAIEVEVKIGLEQNSVTLYIFKLLK